MKMCMLVYHSARINFDRIAAFLETFCIAGYGVCIISFSYNFQ